LTSVGYAGIGQKRRRQASRRVSALTHLLLTGEDVAVNAKASDSPWLFGLKYSVDGLQQISGSRQAAELPDTPTASICAAPAPSRGGALCNTVCIYNVRYEWDEAKNLRNQRDHGGVTFELAALVFEDEACLVAPDRIDCVTGGTQWRRNYPHHLSARG